MIMVYSPVMNAFRLSGPEAGGQPDYHQALMRGFQGAQQAAETVAKPQNLAAKLLEMQLKNKHDSIINQYLDRSENARIGATESNTGMDPLRRQLLQQQISKGQYDQDLQKQLMDAFNAPPEDIPQSVDNAAEGPGVAASASARDTFPGRFGGSKPSSPESVDESIVNEGNPNLYKIDQMYNSSPLMKKMLEGQGYKQTQVAKYDPKTGSTSIVTTSPSGKVTVRVNKGAGQAAIPLTNAIKTQMQNIISGVPKVDKKIDALIAAPSPVEIIGNKPSERAAHTSLVLETAESYAKAKGWPNTNESIKAAAKILDRHTFESDKAYRKRLEELKVSLRNDLQAAKQTLNPNEQPNEEAVSDNDPLGLGL